MRGANLLVHVNAFAMLVDAIGQLARPPLLGLLHLAAFFRAGVLHHAEYLLDVLFRRGRSNDENQIVITRSEEHTSELQSHSDLVCRLLLEKKKKQKTKKTTKHKK